MLPGMLGPELALLNAYPTVGLAFTNAERFANESGERLGAHRVQPICWCTGMGTGRPLTALRHWARTSDGFGIVGNLATEARLDARTPSIFELGMMSFPLEAQKNMACGGQR